MKTENVGRPFVILAVGVLSLILSGGNLSAAEETSKRVELRTKTGEVLVGTVKSRANGKITFQSDTFGTLTVDENSVTVATHDEKKEGLLGQPALGSNIIPHTTTPAPSKAVPVADSRKEKHSSSGSIRDFLHLPDELTLSLSAGVGHFEGTTEGETFDGRAQLDYNKGRYVALLAGQYLYGNYSGITTTDEYEILGRVSRYFGKDGGEAEKRRYFALMQHQYEVNPIRLIDFDYDIYGGLGVDIHKGKNSSSLLAVGGNFEIENLSGVDSAGLTLDQTEVGRAFLLAGLQWKISDQISLDNTVGYQMKPGDASDYEVQWYSTLSYALTKALSLNLNYHYEFDDTVVAGVDDVTTRLTLTLGYKL